MHIPSEALGGAICPVTAAVAIGGLAATAVYAVRKKAVPQPDRFVLATGVVFLLQMVNYPITTGISGHVVGGVLLALLLGTPAAVWAMSLILALQALLLGDGGVAQLGANVVNMALVGAGLGGWLARWLLARTHAATSILSASFLSVMLAVVFLASELLVDGSSASVSRLLLYHLPIAAGEAVATWGLYGFLTSAAIRPRVAYAVAIAVLVAVLPLSSPLPDALETVLAEAAR